MDSQQSLNSDEEKEPADSNAKVGRSYGIVLIGMISQLLVQFFLQRLFARYYGASSEFDAYRAAMTLPIAVSAILAGTLTPVLIPALGKTADRVRDGLVFLTLIPVLLITVACSFLCYTFSRELMHFLQPGFSDQLVTETAVLFQTVIWLLPANTLIGLLHATLNARLSFFIPVIAGVVGPIVTVFVVLNYAQDGGIQVVAWATLIGACANICIQLPFITGTFQFPPWEECRVHLRKMFYLSIPILLGMSVQKIDIFVDRYVLSFLESGTLSRFDYATQIVTVFIVLASGTLSTVAFPRISQFSIDDRDNLTNEVANALKGLATLIIPAAIVLAVFGTHLVEDLFESGEFQHQDTILVGHTITCLSLMALGAGLGELCTKVMYALQETRIPLIITVGAISVSATLKLSLVPTMGLTALALIMSFVYLTSSLVQLCVVLKYLGKGVFKGVAKTVAVSLLAGMLAAVAGYGVSQLELPFGSLWGLVLGAVVYFASTLTLDSAVRANVRETISFKR